MSMLQFPCVSLSAEYLVMGHLLRRNIMTYKAPQGNEGYDLLCIHPNLSIRNKKVIRIQVKSRYQSDCGRGFPLKEKSIHSFDFLVVAFLNIGRFFGKNNGLEGEKEIEFYTLPQSFIAKYHEPSLTWEKVNLGSLKNQIDKYKNEKGFEQIAKKLKIERPQRAIIPS